MNVSRLYLVVVVLLPAQRLSKCSPRACCCSGGNVTSLSGCIRFLARHGAKDRQSKGCRSTSDGMAHYHGCTSDESELHCCCMLVPPNDLSKRS